MAIDTGLGIVCADLQATGGISQILIREWDCRCNNLWCK
jgi:hypothetical protein